MQLSILVMTTMYLAMLTPFTNSLVSLGGILLMMALMATLIVSAMVNSWFAFILFLIYITGLLVLFSYMMAMSPNSYYTSKNKPKTSMIMLSTLILLMMPSLTMSPMKGKKMFEEEVVKIFEPMSIPMYWLIAVTLLVALLTAVTVCFKTAKPLRPFNP